MPNVGKDGDSMPGTIKQKENEGVSLTPNPQATFTRKLSYRVFSCAPKYIEGGRKAGKEGGAVVTSETCLVLVSMHRKAEGKWTQD